MFGYETIYMVHLLELVTISLQGVLKLEVKTSKEKPAGIKAVQCHEKNGNDRKLKKFWIIKQILLVNITGNV